MQKDKKKYLVSKAEFKENNKNPFIAALLSIFLGVIGVHRFYLKRKLTGFIFLFISIGSLEMMGVSLGTLIVIISFVEGIIYIFSGISLFKEKHENNKLVKNMDKNKTIKDINNKNHEISMDLKENGEQLQMEIIEVNNKKPKKIPKTNEFDKENKVEWVKKLRLPYERSIMHLEQVKEETLGLYEKLCCFIDEELRKNNDSLNKEVRKLESEYGYYNNILYTIYCISEGHVTKAYSGNYNYYDPNFSYEILEGHLGKEFKEKVFIKAGELEKVLSFPNDETLNYFNLTKSGLSIVWWDLNGDFREEREFTKEDLNILRSTPSRRTKVWEIYNIKKRIINLYLQIWRIIIEGFDSDIKWKSKNKKHLKDIISNTDEYLHDWENQDILASLIKISENTLREIMPNTQILDTSNELRNINRYLPQKLVDDINNKIIEYKVSLTVQCQSLNLLTY